MSEQPVDEGQTPGESKISPAELKRRAKAEKQARRAAQKEKQESSPSAPVANGNAIRSETESSAAQHKQSQKQHKVESLRQGEQAEAQPRGAPPSSSHHRTLSIRQQQPQSSGQARNQPESSGQVRDKPSKTSKHVELFSHLYTQARRQTLDDVSKDVHPAVLAVGLQMSSYAICGSSARCVAMLLAFKEAIQAHVTPPGTSLARHMTSHYLSPQIDFLKSCRPISESMGNAIRFLKKRIIEIDPSTDDQEAKDGLCDDIDTFIRERITVTDRAIAETASKQIKHGSVVLTYARSAMVEKTILHAHQAGVSFRVIVVDSRPLFEGKNLARTLMRAGLQVEYVPVSGVAHAVEHASLVLVGAHSMLSNGLLQSRVGTAAVAMHAHRADVPVIVCCESVKFSGKVALDSFVLNEIAPEEELLLSTSTAQSGGDEDAVPKSLTDWRDIPNLQVLNLLYDVTPAEYIRMVICEYGSLPPSSVPVVHRLANEGM